MNLVEKKIDSKDIFQGRILHLHVDTVELPNGEISIREVAEHPGGVGILAFDDKNRVAVVHQYRYAFSRVMTEIPAGKRESSEDELLTAQRELREEMGVTADHWESLGELIMSPGAYGERLFLFLASGLHKSEMQLDDDEFLTNEWIPFELLFTRCMNGEIKDAKTIAAVLKGKLLKDSSME